MNVLQVVVEGFILAVVGLLLGLQTRSVRGEIGDLRREMHEEFRSVRADVASVRSDLTQVALAVGVRPRTGSTGT